MESMETVQNESTEQQFDIYVVDEGASTKQVLICTGEQTVQKYLQKHQAEFERIHGSDVDISLAYATPHILVCNELQQMIISLGLKRTKKSKLVVSKTPKSTKWPY